MTTTPWHQVREVMMAVIDACEAVERLDIQETDRERMIQVNGTRASVSDFLVSSWTLPENTRYAIVRARHDLRREEPYVSERARALVRAAEMCAELVGVGEAYSAASSASSDSTKANERSLEEMVLRVRDWHREHFVPGLSSLRGSESTQDEDQR